MKPHSNAILQFCLKLNVASRLKPHKAACHPTKCDVIDDVKLFPTVYRRILSQILTLSKLRVTKASALEYTPYPDFLLPFTDAKICKFENG